MLALLPNDSADQLQALYSSRPTAAENSPIS